MKNGDPVKYKTLFQEGDIEDAPAFQTKCISVILVNKDEGKKSWTHDRWNSSTETYLKYVKKFLFQ